MRGTTLCVGVLLALSANAASAAALGSLATSIGVFAALAALIMVKGWSAHVPASASAGAALVAAAGVAWFWRVRWVERLSSARALWVTRSKRVLPAATARAIEMPPGMELDALLLHMRGHFLRLQDAWDRGDAQALSRLAAPHVLAELQFELEGSTTPGRHAHRTEIVNLHAELLGLERMAHALVASVEFSGWMRESGADTAVPFRELWLLMQTPDAAADWLLARHQALL